MPPIASSTNAPSWAYHGSFVRLSSIGPGYLALSGTLHRRVTVPLRTITRTFYQPLVFGASAGLAGASGGANCARMLNFRSSPGGVAIVSVVVLTMSIDFLK